MIAGELISQNVMPLRTSDTGDTALGLMGDYYIKHLPIVNNSELLGILGEDDILNNDVEEAVEGDSGGSVLFFLSVYYV